MLGVPQVYSYKVNSNKSLELSCFHVTIKGSLHRTQRLTLPFSLQSTDDVTVINFARHNQHYMMIFLSNTGECHLMKWAKDFTNLNQIATMWFEPSREWKFEPLEFVNSTMILAYNSSTGETNFYKLHFENDDTLVKSETAYSSVWTKGWQFRTFSKNGRVYCISYKPDSGRGSLDEIVEDSRGFVHITDYQWDIHWSITIFNLENQILVLFYNRWTGRAESHKLSIKTGHLHFIWGDSWTNEWIFTPIPVEDQLWFLSYKPQSGKTSLDMLLVNGTYTNIWKKYLKRQQTFKDFSHCGILLNRSVCLPRQLRVLTLNVFHDVTRDCASTKLRNKLQTDRIKELKPHVICLQEAFSTVVVDHYKQAFPNYHLIESPRVSGIGLFILRGIFCAMACAVYAILFGVFGFVGLFQGIIWQFLLIGVALGFTRYLFRNNGTLIALGHYLSDSSLGIVVLFSKALGQPLEEHLVCKAFDSQKGDLLNSVKSRGFMSVPVQLANQGGVLHIMNTHLNTGVHNSERIKQVDELIEFTEKFPSSVGADNCGTILCGDTNAHHEEPEMKHLFTNCFQDCWNVSGSSYPKTLPSKKSNPKGFTWHDKNPLTAGLLKEPDQRVDYVAYRNQSLSESKLAIRPVDCQVVLDSAPHVSDHYGVLATFHIDY